MTLAALLWLLAPGLLLPTRIPARSAARRCRIAAAEPAAAAAAPVEASWDAETTVIGGEAPETADFESLGVSIELAANLAANNITAPNALQCAAFASLKEGRDAIVQAHTGSGKTIAFLLPLIEQLDASSKEPQALIISPSRELAFQTARVASMLLEGTGLSCVALSGGANPNRQIERVRKERPQLLVGTPGRVCELAYEWGKLRLQRVRHLVVDEVDEAFQRPYLPDTRRLLDNFGDGRPLQLIFASATADAPAVRRAAMQLMDEPVMLRLQPGAASAAGGGAAGGADGGSGGGDGGGDGKGSGLPSTLEHGVCVLPARKHLEALHRLSNVQPAPKCLVFVNSPHRARMVAKLMGASYGTDVAPLYGEQEREERVAIMRRFLDGRTRLVVCTELGARGLDVPGLTHVVNLEMPTDERHYVHRAGRAGRAGAAGTVLSLVTPEQRFVVDKLAKRLKLRVTPMAVRAGKVEPDDTIAAAAQARGPRGGGAAASRAGAGGGGVGRGDAAAGVATAPSSSSSSPSPRGGLAPAAAERARRLARKSAGKRSVRRKDTAQSGAAAAQGGAQQQGGGAARKPQTPVERAEVARQRAAEKRRAKRASAGGGD